MATGPRKAGTSCASIIWKLTTSAAAIAVAAACTPITKPFAKKTPPPAVAPKPPRQALKPSNPLHIATAYWAEQHKKKPKDANAALSYARNLKAMGSKARAIAVLKTAHAQHPDNPDIASEYGRLVLESGKVQLAMRVLKKAEKPNGKTDWRVLSARGTAYAKLGKHGEAQQFYAAALQKNPDASNVYNNLALSYAMSGSPDKAEVLLRKTIERGHDSPKLRQNLALVLGLQRKFTEAQQVASLDLAKDKAEQNMKYLRSMVRTGIPVSTPKAAPPVQTAMAATNRQPASTAQQPQALRPPVASKSQSQTTKLSSRTMPLPWRSRKGREVPAPTEKRIASSGPVPLPVPKPARPAGPGMKPGTTTPLPTHKATAAIASAPATKAKTQSLAALAPQAKPKAKAKVSSWQASVAPERASKPKPKGNRNLLYPGLE